MSQGFTGIFSSPAPTLTSISPASAPVSAPITITNNEDKTDNNILPNREEFIALLNLAQVFSKIDFKKYIYRNEAAEFITKQVRATLKKLTKYSISAATLLNTLPPVSREKAQANFPHLLFLYDDKNYQQQISKLYVNLPYLKHLEESFTKSRYPQAPTAPLSASTPSIDEAAYIAGPVTPQPLPKPTYSFSFRI